MSMSTRRLIPGRPLMGSVLLVVLCGLSLSVSACEDLTVAGSVPTGEATEIISTTSIPDGEIETVETSRVVTTSSPPPSPGISEGEGPVAPTPTTGLSEGEGPIAPTPTPEDTSAYYYVNEKDNGKTVYMRVGDKIEVDLHVITSKPGYDIHTRTPNEILLRIGVWTETYRDHLLFEAMENGTDTLLADWKIEWDVIDPDREWKVYVVVSPLTPPPPPK